MQRVTFSVFALAVLSCALGRVQGQTIFQRSFRCINRLNEISKIDGVEQTFYLDGILSCYYQEPALPPSIFLPGFDFMPLTDSIKETFLSTSPIFSPNFENKRDLEMDQTQFFVFNFTPPALATPETQLSDVVPGMVWMVYDTRYSGNFKATLELRDFPFDSQTIYINITAQIPSSYGKFVETTSFKRDFDLLAGVHEVIGWTIGEVHNAVEEELQPNYGIRIPRLMYSVRMKRDPGYYVNKIIIGIVILTAISNILFFIQANDANRVMGCLTCLLGIITYLFVISSDVPKMAYSTRLDNFVNMSMYFVSLDLVINLIEYAIMAKLEADVNDAEVLEAVAEFRTQAGGGKSKEPFDSKPSPDESTVSACSLQDEQLPASIIARLRLSKVRRVMRWVDAGITLVCLIGYTLASGMILA
jgi:hypothetical protein